MSSQLVIWNSGSGRAGEVQELRRLLTNQSADWIDLSQTDDLAAEMGRKIKDNSQIVIAAGGDGTVNAAVNALMTIDVDRRPSMGIVPLGTANDFAGTLNIPDDISLAVDTLAVRPIPADIVRIRGNDVERYYANVAAGGNCVRVSEALTDEVKSRWGAFSYIRGAIDVLPDMMTYRVDATCDGEVFSGLDSWAILVANGRTNAGRIEVAPKASTTDGLIDVIIIRDGTIADMVEIVASNLLGDFLACEQIIFRQVRSLFLKSVPPMRFTIDGEVVDLEPVQFEVVPQAIRMHVGTTQNATPFLKAPT